MADDVLDVNGGGEVREVRREWPAWLILAALWLASLGVMKHLPARVPLHWNLQGAVDGWGSPLEAALLLPALATAAYLAILAFDWGRLDFRAARAMAPATTRQVRLLLLLLLAGLQALLLWTSLRGGTLSSSRTLLLLSLFCVFLGNLMPRLEPNAWAGIRIPPTLENREVWKRTHRLGGRWLLVSGLAGLPLCLLPEPLANFLPLPIIVLPLLMATIYAYWLRHRLEHDPSRLTEPR
jgi:uncharacterized membrane protein